MYSKEEFEKLLWQVNYLLNRNTKTLRIERSNGFTYVRDIKTNEPMFPSAKTKKELMIALWAFKKGLHLKIDE